MRGVSVVIGGQFGSEGKGKVALEIVRRDPTVAAAVRVGGSNSGHTGIRRRDGRLFALRQIPAAAIDGNVKVVLPPGSYIDVEILLREIEELELPKDRLFISPLAHIITSDHKAWERASGLVGSIASTGSGTGGAVMARVARDARNFSPKAVRVEDVPELQRFAQRDTTDVLREILDADQRVVIEGSQGFGLSLLHSDVWPKATSRDTTAAAFVAEAGLSPLDVDDITLVLRAFPIRVAGDSGRLVGEITWATLAREAGLPDDLTELTTVTRKVRRVGRFDSGVVRRALAANRPSRLVLNHLDYVDPHARTGMLTAKAEHFLANVEASIGRLVDWVGFGPDHLAERNASGVRPTAPARINF